MYKKKRTASEKLAVIQEVESGRMGVRAATTKLGVTQTSLAKQCELGGRRGAG